jgi:hypothetical protein
VEEAGHTMREIVGQASGVATIMGEISHASQEQRAGIGGVTKMLSQMERITQRNAALVEQVAAAMRVLDGQTHQLADLVNVFRLEEAAREAGARPMPQANFAMDASGESKPMPLELPFRVAAARSDQA